MGTIWRPAHFAVLGLCGLLAVPCAARSADRTSAAQPAVTPSRPATPLAVVVETASGQPAEGPWQQLEPDWGVRLGGAAKNVVPGKDLVGLRRAGARLPPFPRGEQLVLVNGDRLAGTVVGLEGRKLSLRFAGQVLGVPLAAVSLVWLAVPGGPDAADPELAVRRLAGQKRRQDVVLLRNGDTVEGLLSSLNDRRLRLQAGARQVEVERERVAVVALNTDLPLPLRGRSPQVRLVLKDGSRLTLNRATWKEGGPLQGETAFRASVDLPIADVVSLTVLGGAAEYLSDLKPRRVAVRSYGLDQWPPVADGSVAGRELRLGADTFDKGLGVHSETELTYDLGGKYARFEALVGLDPRSGRGGSVRVEVRVDGKEVPAGGGDLTRRGGTRPIRVDLAGARELTLAIRFGDGGPVEDHVNWAEARLVRPGGP